MTSSHRVIHSAETRLPRRNGDRDFAEEFDAPAISSERTAQARPFLSYRVRKLDDTPVRLKITLNNTVIVDDTIETVLNGTVNQVFDHDVLRLFGNDLTVFVPASHPGSVTVSDMLVFYETIDFSGGSGDSAPTGGPL